MARQARLVLADWPHHVIQRGHNRQPVFLAPEDFRYYLTNLEDWKRALDCRVYEGGVIEGGVIIEGGVRREY